MGILRTHTLVLAEMLGHCHLGLDACKEVPWMSRQAAVEARMLQKSSLKRQLQTSVHTVRYVF